MLVASDKSVRSFRPGRATCRRSCPRASIQGRALVAVVAIMTFLASMTTGAVLLVSASAAEWQSGRRERNHHPGPPAVGRDLDRDTAAVTEVMRAQAGIVEVKPFTREESGKLLEPWLGTGLSMDDLPVPRMIIARVQRARRSISARLRARVTQAAPSATRRRPPRLDRADALDDQRHAVLAVSAFSRSSSSLPSSRSRSRLAAPWRRTARSSRFSISSGAGDRYIATAFCVISSAWGWRAALIGGGPPCWCSASPSRSPAGFRYSRRRPVRRAARHLLAAAVGLCRAAVQAVLIGAITAVASRQTLFRDAE